MISILEIHQSNFSQNALGIGLCDTLTGKPNGGAAKTIHWGVFSVPKWDLDPKTSNLV